MKSRTKTHIERQAENLGMYKISLESDKAFRARVGDMLASRSNPTVLKRFVIGPQNETLGELRKHNTRKDKAKLYVFVYRNGALNCLPIYNLSSAEIQTAISLGATMFERFPLEAEEFQNLCYTELHRRTRG